jgi:hypothetical protein
VINYRLIEIKCPEFHCQVPAAGWAGHIRLERSGHTAPNARLILT